MYFFSNKLLLLLLASITTVKTGIISSGKAASWPEKRVAFQEGQRQSPIDLNSKFVISKDLPTFRFINHDTDSTFLMANDGHTIKIKKNDTTCRPAIVGGPLRETFLLDSLHFHWAKDGEKGSEHSIDGFKYAAEAHAVYFNSRYKSIDLAKKKGDGLAVVGFFIEEGSRPNAEAENLLKRVEQVSECGSESRLSGEEALGWADELSQEREYYAYPGSLTTPPYSENVIFIIFPYPMPVTRQKLSALRKAKNDKGEIIGNNWRPVQPICKRLIIHSYNQL